MYETRFGLRRRPFRATPDTAYYYPATGHEKALAQILQAVDDDEGLILLAGAPGTGKTLLCHCLVERLGPETTIAFLTNSHFRDRTALFQAILYDLSLPHEDGTEQSLRLALTESLLKNCQAGRRTVLLVDEAQYLTTDLLEELRLLGNLEAGHSKAFQVILVALPELEETLAAARLAAFNQRLTVRARLEPLDVEEAADYIVHHLRGAGGRPDTMISDEALAVLARATRGVPRLLNQSAHAALALAAAADVSLVDVEVALEALATLGLADEEAEDAGTFPAPHDQDELIVDEDGLEGPELAGETIDLDDGDPAPRNGPFGPPRRSA
jgi:type II secretory pathway predicted ATPase ExeA